MSKSFTNPTPLLNVPFHWTVETIDSLCVRVTSGGTPSRNQQSYFENGTIDWFKTKELKDWYVGASEERITPDAVKNSSAKVLPPNTVLMAMYGDGITITSLGILREAAACNQACCAMLPDPTKCHYLFLFYALKHHRQDFLQLAIGGAQRNLSGALIRNFVIKVPPLIEQHAIAHILGSLDDKIEVNRRANATLEATARALFQSWFVDFDPVHAKARGDQPVGMDAEIAALFPDSFEESELGAIPAGWGVERLNEITDFVIGGDWGKDEATEIETVETLCIRGADIPDLQNGGFGKMPSRFIKPSSAAKRVLKPNDIVIEISGGSPTQSTGRAVFISQELLDRLPYPLVFSNFCRLVRLVDHVPASYVYLWLRSLYSLDAIMKYETGTTGIKNFAYTIFSEQQPLLLPPEVLLNKFEDFVKPLYQRHQANGSESRTLAETRDALLPKLVSGEVRVGQGESSL